MALLQLVLPELPDGVMLKLGMTNPPYMLQRLQGIAECETGLLFGVVLNGV